MNEFKCSCPHCGQHIQGDGQWQGRELQCPTCLESLVVPRGPTVSTETPPPTAPLRKEARLSWELPLWARVVWLVVLGALTPVVVSIAMLITAFLGPLALIAGPVLGTFVSVVLTRHCRECAPQRRFWIYPLSVVSAYGVILAAAFWPGALKSGGHEPSFTGAQATVMGEIGLLLILVSSAFWLLGLAIGDFKKDHEEPSFP